MWVLILVFLVYCFVLDRDRRNTEKGNVEDERDKRDGDLHRGVAEDRGGLRKAVRQGRTGGETDSHGVSAHVGAVGEVTYDPDPEPAAVVEGVHPDGRGPYALRRELPSSDTAHPDKRRSRRDYRFNPPVSGTLCWRDGFKTGPSTPNGQDAYDGKLICAFME